MDSRVCLTSIANEPGKRAARSLHHGVCVMTLKIESAALEVEQIILCRALVAWNVIVAAYRDQGHGRASCASGAHTR